MPTVRNTIKALISCAAVSLASTFITAALNTYGVIDVSAARWELFLAGLVIVGAVTTSDYLCDKSWKHVLVVFVLSIVLVGSVLFSLDGWALRKKAELDARSMPPSLLSKAITQPPPPPAIAFLKYPKQSPKRSLNIVTGNQNVVGNTITQGPGSIAQVGGQGNQATITNITPLDRTLSDIQRTQLATLSKLLPEDLNIDIQGDGTSEPQALASEIYQVIVPNHKKAMYWSPIMPQKEPKGIAVFVKTIPNKWASDIASILNTSVITDEQVPENRIAILVGRHP